MISQWHGWRVKKSSKKNLNDFFFLKRVFFNDLPELSGPLRWAKRTYHNSSKLMLLFPRAHPHTHHHYNVWGVNTTQNPLAKARAFDTSAHVIFVAWLKTTWSVVSLTKTFHLHILSQHVACALLIPYQMSTASLSTLSPCTPIRPTSRPSSGSLLMSSSHGGIPCDDSLNATFGLMPESTSPTWGTAGIRDSTKQGFRVENGSTHWVCE